MAQPKVLCVCADDAAKERQCMMLTAEGYEVVGTTAGKHAAQLLSAEHFDLLVIGVHLPDEDSQRLGALARHRYHIPAMISDDRISPSADDRVLLHCAASLLNKSSYRQSSWNWPPRPHFTSNRPMLALPIFGFSRRF